MQKETQPARKPVRGKGALGLHSAQVGHFAPHRRISNGGYWAGQGRAGLPSFSATTKTCPPRGTAFCYYFVGAGTSV